MALNLLSDIAHIIGLKGEAVLVLISHGIRHVEAMFVPGVALTLHTTRAIL